VIFQKGSRVTGTVLAVQFFENQSVILKNIYLCVSDLMMRWMESPPTLFWKKLILILKWWCR